MLTNKDLGIKKFILDQISQTVEEVVDPEYKQFG
jgi:hypothetical protein